MILYTERLILRPWIEDDAESLYEYAKDPEVGPIAGWPPHKSVGESKDVIKNVLAVEESYAICEKDSNRAIGAIALKLNGHTDMTERDDECELGYWIGKPYWGRGYMPEAAKELLRHGFEDLGMTTIWCGYYDGNTKSKRVQEKVGFTYHHTCDEVPVTLLNEVRVGHTNYMTKEQWVKKYIQRVEFINNAEQKENIARTILEQLPEWFGLPDSTKEYIENSKRMPFWTCFEEEHPIGFIVLKETSNAFYEKLGFKELECFPNLWDEWNPCQVYVKYIAGDTQEKYN